MWTWWLPLLTAFERQRPQGRKPRVCFVAGAAAQRCVQVHATIEAHAPARRRAQRSRRQGEDKFFPAQGGQVKQGCVVVKDDAAFLPGQGVAGGVKRGRFFKFFKAGVDRRDGVFRATAAGQKHFARQRAAHQTAVCGRQHVHRCGQRPAHRAGHVKGGQRRQPHRLICDRDLPAFGRQGVQGEKMTMLVVHAPPYQKTTAGQSRHILKISGECPMLKPR